MFDLSTIGFLLYFLYPILLISISVYVSISKEMTLDSYFFANRNTNWFLLGLTFISSSIFCPYLFSFTSTGLNYITLGYYGIISIGILAFLGTRLAPMFLNSGITTLPEYFEKRFNRLIRYFVSSVYIISNILVRLLILLIVGNILINTLTGADAYFPLLFFLIITGIHLIIGGLHAELYFSFIEIVVIVILIAAVLVWLVGFNQNSHVEMNNTSLIEYVKVNDVGGINWFEIALGLPIIGFWFWGNDQLVFQKILSISDKYKIRNTIGTAAIAQVIPMIVFLLVGFIFMRFFNIGITESSVISFSKEAELPILLKAGMIIGVASIIITSFANIFNSTTMLITFDFYRNFYPGATDRKLVLVGRLTVMSLIVFSILFIPLAQSYSFDFCLNLLMIICYLASMIAAVFLVSLINKKITPEPVLFTLIISVVIILVRSVFQLFYPNYEFTNPVFKWFIQTGFLRFSIFMFFISISMIYFFDRIIIFQNIITRSSGMVKKAFLKLKYSQKNRSKVL